MIDSSTPLPLGLYIHLPWCVRKCPYCDFNSHAKEDISQLESAYVNALIRDLEFELPRIQNRIIDTIFIGGGTPSLFSASSIFHLMQVLSNSLNLAPDIEVTLEANPGTAEAERFLEYKHAGITRLSIGVQSLDDAMLKKLGRIHDHKQAINAVAIAKQAGFNQINLDMMFALPGQNVERAISDLRELIELNPTHISWYQLTLEPNTVFYSKRPSLPSQDISADIHTIGQEILDDSGFPQYEVSAYGRFPCRHNLNYWQFGDYLGLGAGAHGKLTDHVQGKVYRYERVRVPESFIGKAGNDAVYSKLKPISHDELIFEFMLNALRLKQGFNPDLFHERTGISLKEIQGLINRASDKGLLFVDRERIKPTEIGWCYLNDLTEIFL